MKANELRIGNFVYFNHSDYDKTIPRKINYTKNPNEIGLECIFQNRIEYNNIEPIPLTKEWLERFGFETTAWDCNTTHRLMIGKNDYCIVISSNGFCEVGDAIVMNMDYVHQIQNLYFGLTGNELQCVGF